MDARERLRRYLEQRREFGETELVLDSMPVEDVMQMLGARARTKASSLANQAPFNAPPAVAPSAAPKSTPASALESNAQEHVRPAEPTMRTTELPVSSDWRAALGSVGAGAAPPIAPLAKSKEAPATAIPAWLSALGAPMGLQTGADSLRAHALRLDALIAELPSLDAIEKAVAGCTRCPLHESAKNPVPGEGNPAADFVCVGEAPGQNEDEQGRPFVGAAGQLLTKILGAIKLSREDVFICNVLKHRPPGNRDPLPNEVHACSPYLLRQLDLLQPKVILALGSFAARTLLGTEEAIGRLRGKIHMYHGIPVIATYHPAALLRNEAWKRPAWEDVQLARRIYDAARAASPATSG